MNKRMIKGNRLFREDGSFRQGVLYIAGSRIVSREQFEQEKGKAECFDAGDCWVIPGLTDIHFHGCVGYDCCDGTVEAFQKMAAYEASQGVTSITPATMTMPEEVLQKIAEAAREYAARQSLREAALSGSEPEMEAEACADFCGLYMEGPFISQAKKGAQKAEYVRKPDLDMFARLQESSGHQFRTVVIAPETEGAMEMIEALSGKVRVSMGHMTADYGTVMKAIACGASQVTHLYNAMPPYTHRAPGPIGAAADSPDCRVELICDGIHIHPAAVRNTFRMFGDDRIIMISDSMRAAGLPDGESELGGQKVYVKGKQAVLADGTLAGSVTNLMDCLRTAVKEMGIPLESAVKCASVNPAKAAGIYESFGSLTPGKYANIVVLDEQLGCQEVFLHGKKLSHY